VKHPVSFCEMHRHRPIAVTSAVLSGADWGKKATGNTQSQGASPPLLYPPSIFLFPFHSLSSPPVPLPAAKRPPNPARGFWGSAVSSHSGVRGKAPLVPLRCYRSLLFKFWTLRFWATLWGLKDNVRCSLWLIGKRVVDFLLVLIELFSLDVTTKALLAKIDRKSAISIQHGQFDPKF